MLKRGLYFVTVMSDISMVKVNFHMENIVSFSVELTEGIFEDTGSESSRPRYPGTWREWRVWRAPGGKATRKSPGRQGDLTAVIAAASSSDIRDAHHISTHRSISDARPPIKVRPTAMPVPGVERGRPPKPPTPHRLAWVVSVRFLKHMEVLVHPSFETLWNGLAYPAERRRLRSAW